MMPLEHLDHRGAKLLIGSSFLHPGCPREQDCFENELSILPVIVMIKIVFSDRIMLDSSYRDRDRAAPPPPSYTGPL